MDACTVETGLLRKKPCGQTAVTKCANCEQPLCSKHAIAQMSSGGGKKTGTFMCSDCHAAQQAYEKNFGATPPAAIVAAPGQGAAPKPPAKPPAPVVAAPTPKPEAAKPAPAAPTPAKPDEDSLGSIEFTPEKK
jgi:hypothetical protein